MIPKNIFREKKHGLDRSSKERPIGIFKYV